MLLRVLCVLRGYFPRQRDFPLPAFRFPLFVIVLPLAITGPITADAVELVTVDHPYLAQFEPGIRQHIRLGIERLADTNDTQNSQAKSNAYGQLAMVYHAYGLVEPARQSYTNAIALDPGKFTWRYLLAYMLHIQGEFEMAIEEYRGALDIESRYLPGWVHLGQAQLMIDDIAGARFNIGGNAHFAWIRVATNDITSFATGTLTIIDWAYQDIRDPARSPQMQTRLLNTRDVTSVPVDHRTDCAEGCKSVRHSVSHDCSPARGFVYVLQHGDERRVGVGKQIVVLVPIEGI